MFSVGKEKLLALLAVPYMKQMPEARTMSAWIAELDAKQTLHLQDIETNERTLSQLQAYLKPLRSYLEKIQARRGNKLTKQLRSEIASLNKRVSTITKQISVLKKTFNDLKTTVRKIEVEIKELAGAMSRAIREALREIGIELTIYWSGQFVGPQMEKMMSKAA